VWRQGDGSADGPLFRRGEEAPGLAVGQCENTPSAPRMRLTQGKPGAPATAIGSWKRSWNRRQSSRSSAGRHGRSCSDELRATVCCGAQELRRVHRCSRLEADHRGRPHCHEHMQPPLFSPKSDLLQRSHGRW